MVFYTLLLLSGMAIVFFSQFMGKRLELYLCVTLIILLGAVASLRGYVGTDTYSYHLQFEQIKSQDNFDETVLLIEPAFFAIGKFIQFIGGNSFVYVSFIGIMQTVLVIFILTKIKNPALFLLFYIATFYLEFHFNILRASTSSLIILISLLWIKEGGPRFYITLLASFLFHYAAIFVIVYVLLYRQFLNKKYVSAILLVLLLSIAIYGIITIFYDIFLIKYRYFLETDMMDERYFGMGVLLKLCLYIGLAVTLIRKNLLEIIVFVLPLALIRLSMLRYPVIAGRVESFVLPLLIFILTNDDVKNWKRDVIIIALSMLNVYGVLSTISHEKEMKVDFKYSVSPYVPYHTLFDVN